MRMSHIIMYFFMDRGGLRSIGNKQGELLKIIQELSQRLDKVESELSATKTENQLLASEIKTINEQIDQIINS